MQNLCIAFLYECRRQFSIRDRLLQLIDGSEFVWFRFIEQRLNVWKFFTPP